MSSNSEKKESCNRETKDLAFASYAHMKGLEILKAEKIHKSNIIEYNFVFLDEMTTSQPKGIWNKLHVDFANSESRKFDGSVRTLKRLCNSSQ